VPLEFAFFMHPKICSPREANRSYGGMERIAPSRSYRLREQSARRNRFERLMQLHHRPGISTTIR
jgi:hypothetical protein